MISLVVFTQWRLDVGHPERGGGGRGGVGSEWGRQRPSCCIILSSPDMCVAAWAKSVERTEMCWHHYRSDYESLTWLGCVSRLHMLPGVADNPHSSLPTGFSVKLFSTRDRVPVKSADSGVCWVFPKVIFRCFKNHSWNSPRLLRCILWHCCFDCTG